MLIRSGFLCIVCLLLCQKIFGQQHHELDFRIAPSLRTQFENAGVDASGDDIHLQERNSVFEFDLCYSVAKDTGRFFRARLGHLASKTTGNNVFSSTNFGNFNQKLGKAFVGFGIGHSFSAKFITIRMGLECMFAWQYQHTEGSSGEYLNRQGNPEKQIQSTSYPGEVVSSLQLFTNVYLKVGKRISSGIEFGQPLNLILIRGDLTRTQRSYNSSGDLLSTENFIQNIRETRLQTALVFSPILGIRIRL